MRLVFSFLLVLFAVGCLQKACASSMILNWRASVSANIAGYNVYYGTTAGKYPYKVNVGNSTTITVSGLSAGNTYYFVATAYDAKGKESPFSSSIKIVIPAVIAAAQSAKAPVTALAGKIVPTGKAPVAAPVKSIAKTVTQTASVTLARTSSIVSPAATQAASASLAIIRAGNSQAPALIQFPVESGHWYEVQATTNFRDWISVWQSGVAAVSGSMQFADPDSGSFASRFYRLVLH